MRESGGGEKGRKRTLEEGTEENRKGLGGGRGDKEERNTVLKRGEWKEEEEGKRPRGGLSGSRMKIQG